MPYICPINSLKLHLKYSGNKLLIVDDMMSNHYSYQADG